MKNIVLGILAHVDAGKTTMAEAMLFSSGKIRSLGRVDHKDAFLDNNSLEKERGITIFSKQAVFDFDDIRINLLDTPGHMDFSSEMERTLSVLDYAVLVISAPDGVQAHTQTLWSLLSRYHVPTFIWINKMDQSVFSEAEILAQLRKRLSSSCVNFSSKDDAFEENIAVCDELLLERFLDGKVPETEDIQGLICSRKLFPCFFGSALRMQGIEEFLKAFSKYTLAKQYSSDFAARVFKIAHDEKGEKLSYLKITGGSLKVRDQIGDDKISQIRIYNGAKFEAVPEAPAGSVCAVTGLAQSYTGQGLGRAADTKAPLLEPVLLYRIDLPASQDVQEAFRKLSALSEEDPMLRIVWNPQLKEIQAMLMGEVQIEVLKRIIKDRFGMDVQIDTGRIMYRETIESPVEGMGHYEPLRHYAEVHFLMEPLPAGSGIVYESACSTDVFDLNWQRLVLTNLAEKQHLGVLTGSPITDIKITLVAGRAHLKHTEGGDFRQATYRAVRQGLMQAKNILLEPWYDFRIEVPAENIGRAISDVKTMSASFGAPEDFGESMILTGRAPVSEMNDYQKSLLSYTKGKGRISCTAAGYFPCHNTQQVIESIGYDADRDPENTADSVFCSHGAGVNVKWNHVKDFMHLDSGLSFGGGRVTSEGSPKVKTGHFEFNDAELEELMLKEFGPIKRPQYSNVKYTQKPVDPVSLAPAKKELIIADGYNLIFSEDSFKVLAKDNITIARDKLLDLLSNYAAYKGCEMTVVFDGYKVKDNPGTHQDLHGINVVYTPDGITADAYIEKLIHETGKGYSLKVASSDGLIQLSALREGALRMAAKELFAEIESAIGEINEILENQGERTTLAEGARIVLK